MSLKAKCFLFADFIFLLLMVRIAIAQQDTSLVKTSTDSIPEPIEFSLIFTGDVMQHDSQIKGAYNPATKAYEYDSNFYYLKDILSSADYTIANLELTLGGTPYKGYPTFSSPDNLAVSLQNNGIDCLVTANNHSCDRRKKGIVRTIDVLDSLNLAHTGTFKTESARDTLYPMLIEKNGFRLALLNYTYGTNGIPVPSPTVVNLIDKESMKRDLERAKAMNPDKIITVIHWGWEYQSYPNPDQKSTADFLVENGCDIIIGMHPHVIQPMENYYDTTLQKDIVKIYSLGNFISNQRKQKTDGGSILRIELQKSGDLVTVKEVGYLLTWVQTKVIENRKFWYVLPASYHEQHPNRLTDKDITKMKLFISDSRKLLRKSNINVPEYVWNNRITNWTLK